MVQIIIQYLLVILLVVGLGYLAYLLKDKKINIKDDYFGLAYAILSTLQSDEATNANVKKIIRAVAEGVKFVEDNYKNADNSVKEDEALKLIRESIDALGFKSPIDESSIRYLIRIAASMLPPTHSENIEND